VDCELFGAQGKHIEHHVEEEEGELFKKARQALSEEEVETLGDPFRKPSGSETGK